MTFVKLFDGPDATECYQRHLSIVPHQALALFNSELVLVQSRMLARRMSKQFNERDVFIRAAFDQVLARPVSEGELGICRDFLTAREEVYRTNRNGAVARKPEDANNPSADARLHARENLVHSLFNHHDFVTIK